MLEPLLVWGLYPVWLLAGAGDYLCHRRTDIEHTSGSAESWFHLLQFMCLLVAFSVAVLLEPSAWVFGVMIVMVLTHSMLAFLDVSYTDSRRYISPVEQHIHGYLDVLPLMATTLFGVLHWDRISGSLSAPVLSLVPLHAGRVWLLASFAVLAGVPILEELVRTHRHRFDRQRPYQAGLATIK